MLRKLSPSRENIRKLLHICNYPHLCPYILSLLPIAKNKINAHLLFRYSSLGAVDSNPYHLPSNSLKIFFIISMRAESYFNFSPSWKQTNKKQKQILLTSHTLQLMPPSPLAFPGALPNGGKSVSLITLGWYSLLSHIWWYLSPLLHAANPISRSLVLIFSN